MSNGTRGLFCNRTLNLRGIRAIGYDMDYTLVHYHMRKWEKQAYSYLKQGLSERGWPVHDLSFDPDLVIRGLILDTKRGNAVKANRFGYVKRAFHGTEPLDFDMQRQTYQRILVDLADDRWQFLNTLFSISAACMYMQLVDLMDDGKLSGSMSYHTLYEEVQSTLDAAHMEGRLKKEIVASPERFVDVDEEMPLALLDQKMAGRKLLLITNSEWSYAQPMLDYVFNPYLPGEMTWSDLFDISIVGARKPDFFSVRMPAFRVVSDDGMLREHTGGPLAEDAVYVGANASLVEETLGLTGEEILYVGDHLFVDVNITKKVLRWRTALVVRELEKEIEAFQQFHEEQKELTSLMKQKNALEDEYSQIRLRVQRIRKGYGQPEDQGNPKQLERQMVDLREELVELDKQIAPLARAAGQLGNENWGPIMRTGKDKSLFARQVERYADVYTGRVSNFLHQTPFVYLRSYRGNLPHDAVSLPDTELVAP
ncbi:HAD family hydrolase [Longimonas halophila]|uniref:HAD family hydrolase n=1 Tax=Longimonas halophila TaxID=1469170 RepID=A0A2H3NME6_9BACT|nr:HAD-IG family 5'-nucleotidase [Longimonas halophila]PEN07619.1 HAD family hydrolase [Longimonas halophila]